MKIEDAILMLEKNFYQLERYIENLKAEKAFLEQEFTKKEETIRYFSHYKKITIEKLTELKKIIENELKIEEKKAKKEFQEKPISIFLYEDKKQ